MKRIIYFLLSFAILLPIIMALASPANAALNCTLARIEDGGEDKWMPASDLSTNIWFTISYPKATTNLPQEVHAYIAYQNEDPQPITAFAGNAGFKLESNGLIYLQKVGTITDDPPNYKLIPVGTNDNNWRSGNYKLTLVKPGDKPNNPFCTVNFTVVPFCEINISSSNNFDTPANIRMTVTKFTPYETGGINPNTPFTINRINTINKNSSDLHFEKTAQELLSGVDLRSEDFPEGNWQVEVKRGTAQCKSDPIVVKQGGGSLGCLDDSYCTDQGAVCLPDSDGDGIKHCGISSDYTPGKIPLACKEDLKNPGNFKCQTAIGEINTNPDDFAKSILTLLLSIAGIILLALLILNGYKLMTSQGDPEKIKDAREGIVAAIAGVLLIIFSLSILRLITVDILGIPGFR